MEKTTLVSVLICTHNAERFLGATIDSVLRQSYTNLEILVHDDGSTDGTASLLAKIKETIPYPCEVLFSGRKKGPYAGLNSLLDKAKGRYIAILDHDDLWRADKIARQVDFLESHPEYRACGSMTYVLWESFGRLSVFRANERDDKAFHGTLMFRNDPAFRYDEGYLYRNDFQFIRKHLCGDAGAIRNLQEPLALWRIRSDGRNLSRRWSGLGSIWRYIRATRDVAGGVSGYLFNLLPPRVVYAILTSRHATKTRDLSPAEREDPFVFLNDTAVSPRPASRPRDTAMPAACPGQKTA